MGIFSILHEDIKNTRFLLTLFALSGLGLAGLSFVVLAVKGISLGETTLAVFTTIIGALIGLVNVAYQSYFKDRQTAQETANSVATIATTSAPEGVS
jgi:hypothetical protein